MGDWIKENKFEAGLLFVVLLIAIGAFILGSGQGKKYDQHKEFYDAAKGQKKQLESKRPYPNDDNLEDYQEEVDTYRQVVKGLQDALLKFRPKDFKDIAPSEFTERLNSAIAAATERYSAAGIEFPAEKWRLGFERYTETPPREDATAYLTYQLEAMSWLFEALASARPSALINVYRAELPVEKGQSMDEGAEAASGSRGGRSSRSSRGRSQGAGGAPYYSLPLELTFKAPEPSVRNFLGSVASNPEHFFVIRSLRIQNEKPDKPPKRDDVEFKDAEGDDAFGGTFDLVVPEEGEPGPEGEPAPEGEEPVEPLFPDEELEVPEPGAVGGERILGQILGAEELFVFLELELILFKEQEKEEDEKKSS